MIKIPKVQLLFTLILIYLSSLKQYPSASSLYILFTAIGFSIFFDLLFTYLKSRTLFLPLSALITGLIIALTADPNAVWYQVAIVCALSMGFKNFVRIDGKHIFNPAAIGLFLGGVMFNLGVSWWGASFQVIQPHFWNIAAFLILLLPGYVSFYRMRRFGSILSFLIFYKLLSGFNNLFDPTTIFFALVMLPEPMTSPFKMNKQIFYGILVAITTSLLSYPPISTFLSSLRLLPDVLIPALLVGNLVFFKYR